MSGSPDREILTIEEAAELLGVSVKTFNKVLHAECIPARKIGREWKFSRSALIEWVGSGRSVDFYRESSSTDAPSARAVRESRATKSDDVVQPQARRDARRTSGWRIELD